MEKSLYSQHVAKWFPRLVLSIIEQLNSKNRAITYRFMDLLRKNYSVDGRWATLLGNYSRVAADVVAMDSSLPLKSRGVIEKATGNIPKVGMELYLNEKQMSDIDTMIARGDNESTIVQRIFDDLAAVIEGVYMRNEILFLKGLSTGVAIAEADNVGTAVKVDYGYLDANKFGVNVLWDTPEKATPMDDIQKIVDKARGDGNRLIRAFGDKTAINNLLKTKQMKEYFAQVSGFTGTAYLAPDLAGGNAVLARHGILLEEIDTVGLMTEKNGVKTPAKAWQEGTLVFTSLDTVGDLVWTRLAEMNHPVAGVSYQVAEDYILVSKYRENRPSLREYTTSQARVIPVITNVDQIYTLDTKTVEA